jgi:oligopeptide transport system permease protein
MALSILVFAWGRCVNMSELDNKTQQNATVDLHKTYGDFEYVQLDSSLHDTKFQTKPTTFLKDALKRFSKNRSSVTAAIILAVIILMAIIVPLADRNDIVHPNTTSDNLPPKWWDGTSGFLDGTGMIKDATIDPETGLPAADVNDPTKFTYLPRAVVGGKDGIKITETKANGWNDVIRLYGRNGDLSFTGTSMKEAGRLASPSFTFSVADEYTLSFTFDKENTTKPAANNPQYKLALFADYTSDGQDNYTASIPLTEWHNDGEDLDASDIVSFVKNDSSYSAAGSPATFNAAFGLLLNSQETSNYPIVFIKSVSATTTGSADLSGVNFTDGTEMFGRKNAYKSLSNGSIDCYGSTILKGAFRYDYYDAAFGEDTFTYDKAQIQKFISMGYMTFNFLPDSTPSGNYTVNPADFALTELGETYCPVRAIETEIVSVPFKGTPSVNLVCKRSLYRDDYYKKLIPSCKMPHYLFGTNANGFDFFKVTFSGLLTSLELGLLSAVINVIIGLIWGSISGYFGGWTDILMERFTEILGGMPWIVLMTLIILLMGSNFWTFLLALVLTGWMGVAGTTREQFYRFKNREYVLASRTLGASDARLIFRHILPNGIGTIVTGTAFMIPSVIFSEATISYLLPGTLAFSGSQSFGLTLSQAQDSIIQYPYLIVSASIIMMLIMISFNLFGNGLRDAFNPSLKGSNE